MQFLSNLALAALIIILGPGTIAYFIYRETRKRAVMFASGQTFEDPHLFRELSKQEKESLKSAHLTADLEQKVFKVRGNVFKQIEGMRGPKSILSVRGLNFYVNQLPWDSAGNYFDEIKIGDNVTIEYSPISKRIWRIAKN